MSKIQAIVAKSIRGMISSHCESCHDLALIPGLVKGNSKKNYNQTSKASPLRQTIRSSVFTSNFTIRFGSQPHHRLSWLPPVSFYQRATRCNHRSADHQTLLSFLRLFHHTSGKLNGSVASQKKTCF